VAESGLGSPAAARKLAQPDRDLRLVQRKVLTPNDFSDLAAVVKRLNEFEHHYDEVAGRSPGASPAETSTIS
jgi:hypothetical protein